MAPLHTRKTGFTLIELMIVVSIIALLVAAAAASLRNAQVSSRDSKRVADLTAISKAIDAYVAANRGKLPVDTTAACSNVFGTQLQTYLPPGDFPTDPHPEVTSSSVCTNFTYGYKFYSGYVTSPAQTIKDTYILVAGMEQQSLSETQNVLPTGILDVGSSSIRTPHYLPGPYCGTAGC